MWIRASVVTTAKVATLLLAMSAGVACTHPSGSLMVDAPKLLPFEPPDVDEITGIEPADEPDQAPGRDSGSAQNPQQPPRK
jgi:hypothetical protein